MVNALSLLIVSMTLAGAYVLARGYSVRQRALALLYADAQAQAGITTEEKSAAENALVQWLARAGYRQANAPAIFVGTTLGFVVAGIVSSQVYRLLLFRPLVDMVVAIPGSAGDMMTLVLQTGPWIIFVIAGFIPAIVTKGPLVLPAFPFRTLQACESQIPISLQL